MNRKRWVIVSGGVLALIGLAVVAVLVPVRFEPENTDVDVDCGSALLADDDDIKNAEAKAEIGQYTNDPDFARRPAARPPTAAVEPACPSPPAPSDQADATATSATPGGDAPGRLTTQRSRWPPAGGQFSTGERGSVFGRR